MKNLMVSICISLLASLFFGHLVSETINSIVEPSLQVASVITILSVSILFVTWMDLLYEKGHPEVNAN